MRTPFEMNRTRRRPVRRGFTLIEAIVSLVILAAACIACMQIRGQSLASRTRMAHQQQIDRATDAVFQMLVSGLLPKPTRDQETGKPVWKGEHLGKPFTITREKAVVANPVVGQVAYAVAPEVSVWRYTLSYEGRTSTFYWNR